MSNTHDNAWAQALQTDQSFVVDGAGGTGKSELCFQRYLLLLTEADTPEEVLFLIDGDNRRVRLLRRFSELIRSEEDNSDLARAVRERNRQLGWNLETQPERVHIHTLASLSGELVAAAPVTSGCGAKARLTNDPESYYRIAARAMLRSLDHDEGVAPSLETLLLHLDNDLLRAERLLAGLLRHRVELQRCLKMGDPDASREVLQTALADAVAMALVDVSTCIPEGRVNDLVELAAFAARELSVRSEPSPIRACRDIQGLPPTEASQLEAWRGLSELLVDGNGEFRSEFGPQQGFTRPADANTDKEKSKLQERQAAMHALVEQLRTIPGLASRFAAIRNISDMQYTHLQWTVLHSLLAVLPRVMDDLRRAFRALGEIDLTQALQGATQVVAESQVDIFGPMGLQHLIVDDFHEFSFAASDLVEKLVDSWRENDGRSILISGNPFASVRRDAGAQPALYLKLHHGGLGKVKLQSVRLNKSRRSGRAVADWINTTFAVLDEGAVLAEGAMPFWPSESVTDVEGSVEVAAVVGGAAAEAKFVARLLRERTDLRGGTVGVLLGSTTGATLLIDELRNNNIPCNSEHVDLVRERCVIRDLHALTRALLHLADRIAWLSILRAPWCGLTLQDLHALVSDSSGMTVWELIIDERRRSRLTEDGQQRLSRIKRVMAQSLAERGRRDLRRLVEGVWTALGGAVCIRDEFEMRQTRDFFRMLSEIDDGGEPDSIEALDAAVARLHSTHDVADAQVYVTTIRHARRRVYDTVILAGISEPAELPQHDEALRWLVRPGQFGEAQLLLAPVHPEGARDAIDLWLEDLQALHHDHELARLVYAGASRASTNLLLVAAPPRANGSWTAPERHCPLRVVWPGVRNQLPTSPSFEVEPETDSGGTIRRLPSSWLLPEAPQAKVWNVMRTGNDKDSQGDSQGRDEKIAARVMTRTLHEIAENGPTDWAMRSLDGLENSFQRLFGMMGMTESNISPAAERAGAAVRTMLEDSRARWLLDAEHRDSRAPLAVTGWIDEALLAVQVGRSFVDEDGTRWMVDYLYGDLSFSDETAPVDELVAQVQNDVKRKARLVNRLDAAPIRAGVYFPYSAVWRSWDPEI